MTRLCVLPVKKPAASKKEDFPALVAPVQKEKEEIAGPREVKAEDEFRLEVHFPGPKWGLEQVIRLDCETEEWKRWCAGAPERQTKHKAATEAAQELAKARKEAKEANKAKSPPKAAKGPARAGRGRGRGANKGVAKKAAAKGRGRGRGGF